MARGWQTITDSGKLVYKLELGESRGTLEVKEGQHDYGSSWDVYHDGILVKKGWEDVQYSLKYCNELVDKLS